MNKFTRRSAKSCVFLGASVLAMATSTQAAAQVCPDGSRDGCDLTVQQITIEAGAGGAQVMTDGPTHIINNGTGSSITQGGAYPWSAYLVVENRAGASISSIVRPSEHPSESPGLYATTVINRGLIEGDITFATNGIYVNDGGTVTGDVVASDNQRFDNWPGFSQASQVFVN